MRDQFGREINYMRISITDRCNLRCQYCMPDQDSGQKREEILSFEDLVHVVEAASSLGISHIKLTGGEPLVRKDLADLIRSMKAIEGIEEVTITTNGVLLEAALNDLVAAGLDAVNISLDTLDPLVFRKITGVDALDQVLKGLKLALTLPVKVKINTVLMQGRNEEAWKDLLTLAKEEKLSVRFIEMMPIGMGSHYKGVSNVELYQKLQNIYPDMTDDRNRYGNGPAVYASIPGFVGRVGFISAMHGKFCMACNRIRLTSTGYIKPCLCYQPTLNLKPVLALNDKTALKEALKEAIYHKPDAHCFENVKNITEGRNMSDIGG